MFNNVYWMLLYVFGELVIIFDFEYWIKKDYEFYCDVNLMLIEFF